MDTNERGNEVEIPQNLAEALDSKAAAAGIWEQLPEAHRRGHVIAIRRIVP